MSDLPEGTSRQDNSSEGNGQNPESRFRTSFHPATAADYRNIYPDRFESLTEEEVTPNNITYLNVSRLANEGEVQYVTVPSRLIFGTLEALGALGVRCSLGRDSCFLALQLEAGDLKSIFTGPNRVSLSDYYNSEDASIDSLIGPVSQILENLHQEGFNFSLNQDEDGNFFLEREVTVQDWQRDLVRWVKRKPVRILLSYLFYGPIFASSGLKEASDVGDHGPEITGPDSRDASEEL